MATDPTTTPELRLSRDGKRLATRTFPTSPWCWTWRTVAGPLCFGAATDDEVADWTPLVPAPAAADRDAVWPTPSDIASVICFGDGNDDDKAETIWNLFERCQRVAAPAVPAAADQDQRGSAPTDVATGKVLLGVIDDLMSEAVFRAPEGLADPAEISYEDRVSAAALREYAARLRNHPAARAAIAALREVPHG